MSSREQSRFVNVDFGKYTLVERIGIGGMAEIFRGKVYGAHGFEKDIAIKRILPNLSADAEFVSMFIDEAKIMVGLVHNNLVQVYDLGEIDGQYFIGMEFIYGKDLLDLLARCAEMQLKVPLKLGIFIVMEMLKGLDYAHKASDVYGARLGIIHRDVSPSNVLVSYAGDVKVGDFGVAKATTQRSRTEIGTLKGKVGYMSPEQVRGDAIDHRSDIFAAGIILYEVINMRRLFVGGSDLDIMLRVRDFNVSQELKASSPLPTELQRIMERALARDPEQRYQDAERFHADLMDFLYRNRIRVTNGDLARFLGRVFQKEIEQEKLRRLRYKEKETLKAEEKKQTKVGVPSDEVLEESKERTQRSALHEAAAPRKATSGSSFRYRDKSGLIYGPMSADTLIRLLSLGSLGLDAKISEGQGEWQPVAAFPQFSEAQRAAKAGAAPDESGLALKQVSVVGTVPFGAESAGQGQKEVKVPFPSRGELGEEPLPRLLFDIWVNKLSGRLTLQQDETYKVVFFTEGTPSSVISSNDSELLGNFLVRERILSEEQLQHALQRAKAFGGRLGDALVADRLIQSHVLYEYLFKQAKLKLLDVFAWSHGTFEFTQGVSPSKPVYPLGLDALEIILEGVKTFVPLERLKRFFAGQSFTPLVPISDSPLSFDTLRLTGKEVRIAGALRKMTTLDTLDRTMTVSKVTIEDLYRMVFLFIQVRLVRFHTHS